MHSARVSLSLRMISAAIGLAISPASFAAAQQLPQALDGKTAGQVFKNIKVLTDAPADQLAQSMHVIKASVGLDCEECHVEGDFPADAKQPKIIARQMMQMVLDLNKNSFKGQPEITCYTCHRGSPDPVGVAMLPIAQAPKEAKVALPSVDQILAKYVEALGGEGALRRLSSRVITGTQYIPTGPGGVVPMPAAIERDLKAPNLSMNV
jgi:photosynthetic reaction center cytochrome c subunit